MSVERLRDIAVELMKLGVSQRGVQELLTFPPELVERQLKYLPYRKAKRPEAFIIDAVRNNYSAPKEFFYAPPKAQPAAPVNQLDKGSQLPDPDAAANPHGHGAQNPPHPPSPNRGVEPSGSDDCRTLPETDGLDWPQ